MAETPLTTEKQDVLDLAAQQIELYLRQNLELRSHFNRENSALLDGYRGRQLLELVQNADDAGIEIERDCSLLFDFSKEYLVVANTGKTFTKKGLTSLVISDCSPKQLERNRFIGCKGLGFRSILAWIYCPLISSGAYEFAFDHQKAVDIIHGLFQSNPELAQNTTEFYRSEGRWPVATMRFPFIPSEDDPLLIKARNYRSLGYDTVIVVPLPNTNKHETIYAEI